MKNKIIIYFILVFAYLNISNNTSANEFTFDTSEIKILDNGNIINATNGVATSTSDNIQIKANKFIYNKKLSTLNAIGNVEIWDLTLKVSAKSQNIFYNTKDRIIKSETDSIIKDELGNIFLTKSFTYTLNDSLIKINNAKITDTENNIFQTEKAFINLISKKLIANNISIDFNNKSFQEDGEPRLKGNSLSTDGNTSVITGGVFTTCKKRDDCPPWQLSASEIVHDKKKKTIYYKNAWLKLYDKPVFYFPKFFHPDPTVKRQSGFLMPSFNSSSIGTSINVPYYFVLADNKDFTVQPRFYSNEKVLIQSEYREVNATSNHFLDFSILNEKNLVSKSHFFSNTTKKLDFPNFDESELSLQLQRTSNDTYLKTYRVKSPIIDDDVSLLTSSLSFTAYRKDLSLDTNFQIFEDLSKKDSDKYEFIYPSYNLLMQIDNDTKLNGNFSYNSSGYIKHYETNVFEKVVVNDLIFNSDSLFTNHGLKNNYNFLIKNVNTDGKNSKKYKPNRDHKLESIIEYNSSYPLKKELENYTHILKPKISLKYSPNTSKNMINKNRRMDVNSIYSFNRLGTNETVEGGASLTYGAEFSKINKLSKEIFVAKIANVLRAEENKNLPHTSNLGKKTSDIVGYLNYDPNNIFKITYDFSIDENLNDTNYQLLGSEFKVNNFITKFEYLNENNTKAKASYLTNKTTYSFNDSSDFIFETRKNKKTKLTEFYNLMYQYRNDCLIAEIEYNRDYYSDRDLRPEDNIFLKLTIIPFGKTSSPNLKQ